MVFDAISKPPCFKLHNLFVIQLNNTKLGQMTNLKVAFKWWCQFINLIKFATRPSPLLNLKEANCFDFFVFFVLRHS